MHQRHFKIFVVLCLLAKCSAVRKPNIIFILADDLGWNDVGFHGSNQIPTPNIDALAYAGIILNQHYVLPLCTPSRAALMTARHPTHTGMQHEVIYGFEPWGLDLEEKLLPEYLKEEGYATHLVGKWHLGHFKKEYTPTYRGFDTHFGYWSGHIDYYDHNAEEGPGYWGHDLRRDMNTTREYFGQYATSFFTDEAVRLIQTHDKSFPMFLYMAHAAPHSGNPSIPLQAPEEVVQQFKHIENKQRRIYAAMVSLLDRSVGAIVSALSQRSMLQDSIIVFCSDNGGAGNGYNYNEASNWPFRGGKDTTWEGGVRGVSLIWSPLLRNTQRVSMQFAHIQDWLPTLLGAINFDLVPQGLDGQNLWPALNNPQLETYNELMLQIDPDRNISAIRIGNWKLVEGTTWKGYYDVAIGISGRNGEYDVQGVLNSETAMSLAKTFRPVPDIETIISLRKQATITCQRENASLICHPEEGEICLFDLSSDPCESVNLANSEPLILTAMKAALAQYRISVVPARNAAPDPTSNPKFWGYTWTHWQDFPTPPGAETEMWHDWAVNKYKII